MAVSFHGERAAVFMPEPAGDGRDVDSGFDPDGGEQMPKIMVGDAQNAELARPLRAIGFRDPAHFALRKSGQLLSRDVKTCVQ